MNTRERRAHEYALAQAEKAGDTWAAVFHLYCLIRKENWTLTEHHVRIGDTISPTMENRYQVIKWLIRRTPRC